MEWRKSHGLNGENKTMPKVFYVCQFYTLCDPVFRISGFGNKKKKKAMEWRKSHGLNGENKTMPKVFYVCQFYTLCDPVFRISGFGFVWQWTQVAAAFMNIPSDGHILTKIKKTLKD